VSVVANVAINVDSRGATQKLREVQSQAQQTERAFGGLASAAGKLAAAFAAVQAVKFVFVQAAELESQRRSLEVLTGSAQQAGKIIKELQDLGAVTPFTSTELIDSAKRLQAFGVEANKVVETTRRLADVSGATGAELQGLVTAYGQVQAKGRLQGEELLQFQERGVALQQILKEEYKLSGDEFQKALEGGRISAQAVEAAIIKLTDAGGKYANGAIAQSDTLNGKLSTLQDSFQRLAQNIGTFFAPVFKFLIDGINAFIERVNSAARIGAEARAYEEANKRTRTRFGALRYANPFDQEVQQYRERLRKSLVQSELGAGAVPAAPTAGAGALPALLAPKGGKDKTKKERESQIPALQNELALQNRILEIVTDTGLARLAGNKATEAALQIEQILEERSAKIAGINLEKIPNAEKELKIKIATVEADKQLVEASFARQNAVQDLRVEQEKQIAEILSGLDMEILKLQAKTDAEQQAIRFLEIENQLKADGKALTDLDAEAIRRKIAEVQKLTKEQQKAQDQAKLVEQQFANIGAGIGDMLTGAFDNLISKTKDWNDVLRESLMAIGKMLMMAGLNMLAGTDGQGVLSFLGFGSGFGKRAAGGPVSGGSPYLVGERGPELFVPGTGGTVVNNNNLRDAMGNAPGARNGPMLNMTFQTTNIGGVEYVSRDQLEAAMVATRKAAANDGAKRGTAATLSKLQNSPSTRAKLGLR
jgi:tape measure domain-containing protein